MRAIHVIAGLRPEDGGPTYTVPRLCHALAAAGAEIDLMTVSETVTERSEANYRERHFGWSHAAVPVLRAARASSGMARGLREASKAADVIHNHGLWLLPNVYSGWEATRAGRPLVIAPRGMLSPAALSFSRLKKRAFWHLLQKRPVAAAACFHATSGQEYEEIRAFGLGQPVAIIPNGIDVERGATKVTPAAGARTILSLGRVHPKKGLDVLLRAWARLEPASPDWRLRIIGPAEAGHDEMLRSLARELGLSRAFIEGPIYGPDKYNLYASSELFVLPTRNDNFAMTVAEALAAGIPVIASKGAPWKGLVENGCGWWIEQGIEPLAEALSVAMTYPRCRLTAMGEKGRAWMLREFSWNRVGRDMMELYNWLTGSMPAPDFVRFA